MTHGHLIDVYQCVSWSVDRFYEDRMRWALITLYWRYTFCHRKSKFCKHTFEIKSRGVSFGYVNYIGSPQNGWANRYGDYINVIKLKCAQENGCTKLKTARNGRKNKKRLRFFQAETRSCIVVPLQICFIFKLV